MHIRSHQSQSPFLAGLLWLAIPCAYVRASAMPPPVVDVPGLLLRSDIVVAGRLEPSTALQSGGTERFRNTLKVDRFIKGSFKTAGTILNLRIDAAGVSGKEDVALHTMYGLFFLKKEGNHYTLTDPNLARVVAAPLLRHPPGAQVTDLDKAAEEIAEVFTISPDIVVHRGTGLDFGGDYLIPLVSSSTNPDGDISKYRIATALNRAEQVYGQAGQALFSIPFEAVKAPLISAVDSRGPLIGRLFALSSLLMRGDSSRLETFMPYLLHPSEEATGTNAELEMGLAGLDRSETLVPVFAKLLQSTNERIREAAILRLKDSDSPEALAGLDAALHDEDFQVRLSAVFGICKRTRACLGQNPTRMARTDNIHAVADIFHAWMAERHHG